MQGWGVAEQKVREARALDLPLQEGQPSEEGREKLGPELSPPLQCP